MLRISDDILIYAGLQRWISQHSHRGRYVLLCISLIDCSLHIAKCFLTCIIFYRHMMALVYNNVDDLFQTIRDHEIAEKVSFVKQTTTKLFGNEGVHEYCMPYLLIDQIAVNMLHVFVLC